MATALQKKPDAPDTDESSYELDPAVVAKCLAEGRPLKELLDLDDSVWETMYEFGFHNFQNAQFEAAEFWWTQTSLFDSQRDRNWIALGVACKKQCRWEQALNAFSMAAHFGSTNPWVALHAAECLMQLEKLDKVSSALDTAQRWLQNSPEKDVIEKRIAMLRRGVERRLQNSDS